MWHEFAVACCLVLVLEGVLPFTSPRAWRRAIVSVARMDDRSLRLMGLVSMLAGVGALYLVNG